MHTATSHARSIRQRAVSLIAAAAICIATPVSALADEPLESLQLKAIEAAENYQSAQDQADQLQQRILDTQAKIEELEAKLPGERQKAASAIRVSYRMSQDQSNLVTLLLASENFNQFITALSYLDNVTSANLNDIQNLNKTHSELEAAKSELESQKSAVDTMVSEAQDALAKANSTRQAAEAEALKNADAARAAYEAQQAAGIPDQSVSEIQKAEAEKQNSSEQTTSGEQSSNDSKSSSGQGNQGSSEESVSYTYVGASMYGEGDGFMWGTTASGDIVTPTSMGVAMKHMRLGTIIEISYNGRTATAVVNDRGPYIAGREIDLQPAVAHALGFDGIGTVGYRVIG